MFRWFVDWVKFCKAGSDSRSDHIDPVYEFIEQIDQQIGGPPFIWASMGPLLPLSRRAGFFRFSNSYLIGVIHNVHAGDATIAELNCSEWAALVEIRRVIKILGLFVCKKFGKAFGQAIIGVRAVWHVGADKIRGLVHPHVITQPPPL